MRLITLTTALTVILIALVGCSSGGGNSVTANIPNDSSGSILDSLPVIAFDGESAIGLLGAYSLVISPDTANAELIPMRSSALGESFIVSGEAFFTMSPCTDCLQINNIALDVDGNIVLGMSVKHPFPKGDTLKPPSAMNRLDLDVFDLALLVNPLETTSTPYTLTGVDVFPGNLVNADGYSTELGSVIGDDSALPYKICYEDENNNRFEMGLDYQPFDIVLSTGPEFAFDLFLTMGYGASAKKPQRLIPTYYVPEYNRKSAWKVEVTPPEGDDPPTMGNTWDDMDSSALHTVAIDIYDWNHGATISPDYPDPANTDQIAAQSDVTSVTVEVPGMTSSIVNASTIDTTSNGWDDPLTYTASFANENQIPAGEYYGLVRITDSRIPGESIIGGETDTLVHTPDGILLEWYNIPEFTTYQIFTATVVVGGVPPQIFSIDPDNGYLNCIIPDVLITGQDFDSDAEVTLTLSTGGTPVDALDEVVDPGGTTITCTLDLDSTFFEIGLYDVTVTNPTSTLSDTLVEGFEVLTPPDIEFENEVQPFNHPNWDEFSPCISQDSTGRLIAFWHADTPTISADVPGRSYNGTSWSGGSNVFGTSAPYNRFDVLKIAPKTNGGTFVLINFVWETLVAQATDYGAFGGGYVFNYPGRSWHLEMMVDASGYGYGCGDRNGNIVFQKTPNPNIPGNSTTRTIAPGRLSHVRSWGLDSSGLLYLAFLDTGLSNIQLSHGTDNTNINWTSPIIVFEDSNYDDVRDPSVHLVGDVIHLSFLRHDISSGDYELCYTQADISDLNFSTPVVADSLATPIEDAHIQAGTYFDASVVAIAYQKQNTAFLVYSHCNGTYWNEPIVAQETYSATEDCDMVFLEQTGSLPQDFILIWTQDIGGGNRNIVTRMGHFTE
ncbi:hypothetical protein J7L05_10035 [bacterium]|nr:hypothetical protein [bacterium]